MVYLSCNSVDKTERNAAIDQSIFSPEFINGLKFSGVPSSEPQACQEDSGQGSVTKEDDDERTHVTCSHEVQLASSEVETSSSPTHMSKFDRCSIVFNPWDQGKHHPCTVTKDSKSRSKRVRRPSHHLDHHADFGSITTVVES
ncbi:hypothetical protein Tco_0191518 [Tanacetum coccineum]